MHDAASVLAPWANFYVIVGTAAATLTGLMFIIITLVAGRPGAATAEGVAVFTSPTVVHFGLALIVAGILAAPWPSLTGPAVLLACAGGGAMLYGARVLLRAVRQMQRDDVYVPDAEDWTWFLVLPLAAHLTLVVAALRLPFAPRGALFAVAAAVALLVAIGLRNAWDVVTYLVVHAADDETEIP